MKLLDLLFKTDKNPTKEVLIDDIIQTESRPKKTTVQKPISAKETITTVDYNNINVYSPQNQEEIEKIVLNLIKNEASIINLKDLSKQEYTRVLDFLSGAVFALKGTINRLTQDLYLITPENLKIKVLL